MASRLWPEGVPKSIKYPEIPLYSLLENSARKFPNRVAAIFLNNKLTYGELWNYSLKFASGLRIIGIDKGDNVSLLLPNTPHFIIAINAIHLVGAAAVPVNPLNSLDEIKREVTETRSRALITLDRLLDKTPETSCKLIIAEATSYTPRHLRMLSPLRRFRKPKGYISFQNLASKKALEKPVEIEPSNDLAAILYTSGTTGRPKGVMLTHFNLVANALQSYFWLRSWGYSPKPQPMGWPVILCATPFFHSYGLNILNEAVSFGCTLALVPDPKPSAILEVANRTRCTHLPLIPRFVKEILDYPSLKKYDLSSVIAVSTGGAALIPDLMKHFEELAECKFYQGYGLTEAAPTTHASPFLGPTNYYSAGLPYPDTDVKVVDLQLDDVEMPIGQAGELLIKGPQVMRGYWMDDEGTAKALRNGWLHTGDIVRVDKEGWLYVIGRKSDLIVSSGHNVFPKEVEDVVSSHPSVLHVIAIGAPDPLRCNTDIHIFVQLRLDAKREGIESKILELCRTKLKPYQVPSRIEVVLKLPLTSIGKVDRLAVEAEVKSRIEKEMEKSVLD